MKYVINYLVSIKVQLIFEHFNIEGLDKYMSFNMKLKLVLQIWLPVGCATKLLNKIVNFLQVKGYSVIENSRLLVSANVLVSLHHNFLNFTKYSFNENSTSSLQKYIK